MKSNNLIIIIIIVFLTSVFIISCKKYEEGPLISFRSPVNRISGDWFLNFTKINGQLVDPYEVDWLMPSCDSIMIADFDFLPDDLKYFFLIGTFQKDGDGKFTFFSNIPCLGLMPIRYFSWTLDVEKKNIIMNYEDKNCTLEIIRLTNKEMTLEIIETGDGTVKIIEMEFIKASLGEYEESGL